MVKSYGAGIKKLDIIHYTGKANVNAHALSRNPQFPAPNEGIGENELQVAQKPYPANTNQPNCWLCYLPSLLEQEKDSYLRDIIQLLESGILPVSQGRLPFNSHCLL